MSEDRLGEEAQGEPPLSTRGAFIKRMVAVGFSAPMIGSFGFTELASAACKPHQSFPNQTPPGHDDNPPPHDDHDDHDDHDSHHDDHDSRRDDRDSRGHRGR